jgi:hypothetical protein
VKKLERPGIRRAVPVMVLGALILGAPFSLSCQVNEQALPWSSADSTVSIGGEAIGLRVVAWRDFMPRIARERTRGEGSPLMVSLQIVNLRERPLPDGITVDSVWVRSPEGTWSTAPSSEPRPGLPNGAEFILRGGPKWKTDQLLDVLVRLRAPDGSVHHLQRRGQRIGRTQ